MKLNKKVLVAALALSLTSTGGFAKNNLPVNISPNLAYASEDKEEYEFTMDDANNIHEFLTDKFLDLLSDEASLEKLTYKEDYKKILEDLEKEPQGEEGTDNKIKNDLVGLLTEEGTEENNSLEKKLSADIENLKKETDDKGESKTEEEKGKDAEIAEKLEEINKTIGLLDTKEETKEGSEETQIQLIFKDGADIDFYKTTVVSYISAKRTAEAEYQNLLDSLKSSVEKFKYLDDKETKFNNISDNNLNGLKEELKKTKDLLNKEEISKEDLEKQREALDNEINTLRENIKAKFDDYSGKLGLVEGKLTEEEKKPFLAYYDEVNSHLEDLDLKALDKDLDDLEGKTEELDKLIESKNTDKSNTSDYKTYEEIVKAANNLKSEALYYRSSKATRDKFDQAIINLDNYIKEAKKDESKFKKEEADKLSLAIADAKDNLDGKNFDDALKKLKKKLTDNKKNLSKDDYKDLAEKYNKLADEENKEANLDDIAALSKEIDEKLQKGTLVETNDDKKKDDSGVKVTTKKVAVPKANTSNVKSPKSIVRTGIDSVKAFGIIAAVAIVLLLVTNKNKKNK